MLMDEIVLVDYDPRWSALFAKEEARIREHLVVAVEHFGSTSVPGLAAKAIIDLMVLVRSVAEARRYDGLKRDLVERFREDREAYTDAKGKYVQAVMAKAHRERGIEAE